MDSGDGREEVATDEGERSVWQTVRADIRRASGSRLAGVVLVLLWMAFQWGWGNDVLLPTIVGRVFDAIDDGDQWRTGGAAVGAATAAGSLFWAVTQFIDGVVVLTGTRLIPGVTRRISAALGRQGWTKPYADISLPTRIVIAYVSGASALCLLDVFASGREGLRGRKAMLGEAVLLAVASVGAVILIVTVALAVGARIPATEPAASVVVRLVQNPLTWIVLYGGGMAVSAAVSRLMPGPSERAKTGSALS